MGLLILIYDNTGKRNDEEDAKEKLYTYASYVPVLTFKVRPVILLLYLIITHLSSFLFSSFAFFVTYTGPRDHRRGHRRVNANLLDVGRLLSVLLS